ncbi:hypothetical protein HYALB_00013247 [Hymenoscyphus albidus]|uniref:Uncharacterized protein n=1 Tax=Hymenoscyphus albidus TaxID=595503 RepID=A0A9N9LU05_9HELO|nr:hypothetical protein HYALB_00013247 [Hymenoscyphus albidus]
MQLCNYEVCNYGSPLSSDASPITVAIFWSEDLRRWRRQWSPALLPAAEEDQTASLDETRHQTKQALPSASSQQMQMHCCLPLPLPLPLPIAAEPRRTTVPTIHALWRCSGPQGESAVAAASNPKFEEDSHGHHTAAAAVVPALGAFAPFLSPSLVAHAVVALKEVPGAPNTTKETLPLFLFDVRGPRCFVPPALAALLAVL